MDMNTAKKKKTKGKKENSFERKANINNSPKNKQAKEKKVYEGEAAVVAGKATTKQ